MSGESAFFLGVAAGTTVGGLYALATAFLSVRGDKEYSYVVQAAAGCGVAVLLYTLARGIGLPWYGAVPFAVSWPVWAYAVLYVPAEKGAEYLARRRVVKRERGK